MIAFLLNGKVKITILYMTWLGGSIEQEVGMGDTGNIKVCQDMENGL